MASSAFFCSFKFFLLLLLLSALPIAYIIHSETNPPPTHLYQYHAHGWFREGARWDDLNRRFIISFLEGGLGVIPIDDHSHSGSAVLHEIPVINTANLANYSYLGLLIDRPRNRVVVAISDPLGFKFSGVAAYDLATWNLLFLTQLNSPDEKALADDVAVDADGNAYVVDAKGNKIWKVGADGKFLYTIESPLFAPKKWYHSLIGLNGIVYHPNGYLIVSNTISGDFFKIEIGKGKGSDEVKLVNITHGSTTMIDGMELVSPTQLAVAGMPSRLLESKDDWESAGVVGKFWGLSHRLVSALTVKDGKVYLNHLIGMGYPKKKHLLLEAVFSFINHTTSKRINI